MNERIYGEALYTAVSGGLKLDAALRRLKEVQKEHGHESLYLRTLKDAEARFQKDAGSTTVEITLARESDKKTFAHKIKAARDAFGSKETVIRIDDSITGGYIARTNNIEIDASYKKSLLTVYRSLTA